NFHVRFGERGGETRWSQGQKVRSAPTLRSGAFPMGVLHKLVFVLNKLDPSNARWRALQRQKAIAETEHAYQIGDQEARQRRLLEIDEAFERNSSDYGRKLYLIENCIYGVDIQPIAVQIAKLRFFISLVVEQTVDDGQPNRGILPLPNLETRFVAANTLIGLARPQQLMLPNPEINQKEQALARVRQRHFTARSPAIKEKYRQQDAQLRAELSRLLQQDGWTSHTAEELAHWDPYDQNASAPFFDPEWMFGISPSPSGEGRGEVDGGFSIVIGNPPYVRQEKIRDLKPALQKQYTCYTGAADLYVYFYERGLRLLRPGGVLTYISSNKYFRSGYGEKLRQYLAANAQIGLLIDFGDAPVFTAIAYPSIILARKGQPAAGAAARALAWPPNAPLARFVEIAAAESLALPQTALRADGWRIEDQAARRLLDKLRRAGRPLGEYVHGRFYYGIKTGLNEAFVVDRPTRDRLIAGHPSSAQVLKPFLRGRDVKRWTVDFAEQYLIRIESSENKPHPWSGQPDAKAEQVFAQTYPAIYAHFQTYRDALQTRQDQGKYFWELRSCRYWPEFEQPKIVYPDIAQKAEFSFDDAGYYLVNTLYLMPTEQKWLLGLLNSQVVFWFYTKTSTQIRGGFVRFIAQYVSQIPIPETGDTRPIEALVERILALKRANPAADVSATAVAALEREIDQHVYAMYGLTAEEIAIVEAETG
ncbi:MAG: Eco57I restriction-modification methylase domain-containing protein, partial [Anaerolineae bacterium]|nr:Eco57I restriction-modification methylase domain-containing protein [Anaerolineae bacterium]